MSTTITLLEDWIDELANAITTDPDLITVKSDLIIAVILDPMLCPDPFDASQEDASV